ncbi:hypothetical protein HZS_5854, partial [Henneguya salminicola]
MASLTLINPKADLARAQFSLQINTSAARGLQDVLSSNLGPREMQIQHPTAALISRVAATQDDITGDGTTSTVLLVGELLRHAELLTIEGMHPRHITLGYAAARDKSLELICKWAKKIDRNREILLNVARTSLDTKVQKDLVPILTEIVVDAVLSIKKSKNEIDLHMVEIMEMLHKSRIDTRLVKGLVMDHGGRHANMPNQLKNVYILTCNVSLEYEKTEVNSGYFYKTTEERVKMAEGERKFTDYLVRKIIEFKKKLCDGTDKSFLVVNQKGIDLISLGMLAQEGILALRRAKRRNMERIVAACGGNSVNSLDGLTVHDLGHAGLVSEYHLGEEKFTFIQDVPLSGSVTILINGPTKHCLSQIKDAIRDGLRAVYNAIKDRCVLPGAGSVEVALKEELINFSKTISGKEQLGVVAFANALLVIPRTLSKNAGLDQQEIIVKLTAEYNKNQIPVGVDLSTGKPIEPFAAGVLDNLAVKRQILTGCTSIATNLLL